MANAARGREAEREQPEQPVKEKDITHAEYRTMSENSLAHSPSHRNTARARPAHAGRATHSNGPRHDSSRQADVFLRELGEVIQAARYALGAARDARCVNLCALAVAGWWMLQPQLIPRQIATKMRKR